MTIPSVEKVETFDENLDSAEDFVNSSAETFTTHTGLTRQTITGVINSAVQRPIVPFDEGDAYPDDSVWVEQPPGGGLVYRPKPSALPIAAGPFDYAEWVLASASGISKIPGAISFQFDDAFVSQMDLADLFEARGIVFGLAAHSLNGTNQLTTAQALDLQSRGFEFLAHGDTGHNSMRDESTVSYATAKSYIEGGFDMLEGLGLNPVGFVAPFSEMKREFMPIVRNKTNLSWTVYPGSDFAESDPTKAVTYGKVPTHGQFRVSPYHHTVAECQAIIDEVKASGGLVTFYDHDPSRLYYASSVTVENLMLIVDYAIAQGVPIIAPSQIPVKLETSDSYAEMLVAAGAMTLPNQTFTTFLPAYDCESDFAHIETDGLITIKKPGYYQIEVSAEITTNPSATAQRMLTALQIDGTNGGYRYRSESGIVERVSPDNASPAAQCRLSVPLWLNKNQTVSAQIWQESGASQTVNTGLSNGANIVYSFISLVRFGD